MTKIIINRVLRTKNVKNLEYCYKIDGANSKEICFPFDDINHKITFEKDIIKKAFGLNEVNNSDIEIIDRTN